ncbi:retinol dehydrogenase [Cadophora sp. MPI-SDFR-AT-0126]|nr:retinol dehydrogenase [Leotiomycetes sp. MPI-SDFR-AT-0126]
MAISWDPSQLPDLTGRVAIITGGHSGLGLATTAYLAAKHAKVYVASRSQSKAQDAIRGIKEKYPDANVEVLVMDLSDQESVKKGVEEFLRKESELHILINNAGIMCAPYSETKQGFEIQFTTNYFSHYLFTALLLPTLIATASHSPPSTVRIINVSSDGHAKLAPSSGINLQDPNLKSSSPWARYGHSKLCQVLHAKQLASIYGDRDVVSASLHPGTVKTGLANGPKGSSWWYKFVQPLVELGAPGPERGCWGVVWCAASRELGEMVEEGGGVNGGYFLPVGKLTKASKCGDDREMARKLWEWSEERCVELGLLDEK